MTKFILFTAFLFQSAAALAGSLTEPLLMWPSTSQFTLSKACENKVNREIQNRRMQLDYPQMGTRRVGMYTNRGGVSYSIFEDPWSSVERKITGHKILLRGLIYEGSSTLFSAAIVVPESPCSHYFERWRGQLDSESSCNVLEIEHEIDRGGYNAC